MLSSSRVILSPVPSRVNSTSPATMVMARPGNALSRSLSHPVARKLRLAAGTTSSAAVDAGGRGSGAGFMLVGAWAIGASAGMDKVDLVSGGRRAGKGETHR